MTSCELQALRRSLHVYHGDKARRAAMDALYRRFLKPDDLAFDIGAHVGDRTSSIRRLGCRVVALEPQPLPVRALRLIHGRDSLVTVLQAAAGPREGTLMLHVNSRNPTVSTASADFVAAACGAGGWEGQVWDRALRVPCFTLDNLIERFGRPAFVKIDVEGFEADVLAGLSQVIAALSFEFTTIQREVAFCCLERLTALGPYRFDISLGESQRLTFDEPISAQEMADYIAALAHEVNSGDVYAMLRR
ncbi:MAG TPA: FkbM family methyltransferase [Hyphomicrobiaceae bacterium]|jgi:FkbM family methyltransferase|nr:FkbM family methyltransferase [Hyphomicrobiaceae bacterium]